VVSISQGAAPRAECGLLLGCDLLSRVDRYSRVCAAFSSVWDDEKGSW
jgi:hypothetical protein